MHYEVSCKGGGMRTRKRVIPEVYGFLQQSTHHVEGRAATGLYNYLTANSLLVLAWATIFAGAQTSPPGKSIVMVGISVIGVLTGLQWALLGTRTWQYALEYADQLRSMWAHYGFAGHAAVDASVARHWKKRRFVVSANHWVLFLAPLALSLLHMLMLSVVIWSGNPGGLLGWCIWAALTIVWTAYYACIRDVWKQCSPILNHPRRVASPMA